MKPANFSIVDEECTADILTIRDEGGLCGSVTNDAERVVDRLIQAGKLPPGRKLHYYDSDGRKDELLIENGRFAGFNPLPQ